MNTWQAKRAKSGWGNGLIEWLDGNVAYISVVFSWLLDEALRHAEGWRNLGYTIRIGGPSAILAGCSNGENVNALPRHNKNATFTSRGCIRKCSFCAVPKIEGDLIELDDWEPRPIVCDNNLLACSKAHFDKVIDGLKPIDGVDFNQGLDARLLTKYHAERLAELNLAHVRLAWDNVKTESQFMRAFEFLHDAGIPARKIGVYVLIGYNDTPEDALYRLEIICKLGMQTNPMRYQPLDAKTKNCYVGSSWTGDELQRYMRYWSNDIIRNVPFAYFARRGKEPNSAMIQMI